MIKFKNIQLLIIGDGSKKKLNDYIIKKLSSLVKIIYKSNPYKYIKKANIFLLTSKFEGLPNVLLEAQVLKNILFLPIVQLDLEKFLNGKAGDLVKIGVTNQYQKNIRLSARNNKFKNELKEK